MPLYNQEIIEQAFIMYMIKYNITLQEIIHKFPKTLENALIEKREDVVKLEAKIKKKSFN